MEKEIFSKTFKKVLTSSVAAVLLASSVSLTSAVFASADEQSTELCATGCIPDSEETIKSHLASDEEVYGLDYIEDSNDGMHDTLVEVCKAATQASLPDKVDLTDPEYNSLHVNQFPAPGDQGSQGSCVCWAVGYSVKSHEEFIEHYKAGDNNWDLNSTKTQFSPAFVFNQIKISSEAGSNISDAFELIGKSGVCSLYNMPYNQYDCDTQPKASQNDIASNFKTLKVNKSDYFSTIKGVDEVEAQINQGHGVVIHVTVYPDFDDAFVNPDSDHIYDEINDDEDPRGGHAICIVGYDHSKQLFKIMNSWGTKRGENGFAYMTYEMFEDTRNSKGYGYIFNDQSHEDSDYFFTNNDNVKYVKVKKSIRAYTNRDYYIGDTNTDEYEHSYAVGDIIKIDSFYPASNGLPPCFKTSDGLYINASKEQLEDVTSQVVSNVFISGSKSNSVSSYNNSETSSIKFNTNNSTKYNNHNTLRIDYTVNQSDSYNGYAGAKIQADSTVSTEGATGLGFWYMTPAGQNGTVAFCMQGSVNKKLVELPTTNGEWKYYKNNYSFNGSSISDIEIYINGNENNCKTTPASGTIYIADLAAVSDVSIPIVDKNTYYSFNCYNENSTAGTVITTDDNGKYAKGTKITVKANENEGHKFLGWSKSKDGDIFNTDATYTFSLEENTTLYAQFGYELISSKADGCKSILVYTATQNGEEFANSLYKENESISLKAIGENGYTFKGWYDNVAYAGDPVSTSAKYTFKLTECKALYPKFVQNGVSEYTVKTIKPTGCRDILLSTSEVDSLPFVFGTFVSGKTITLNARGDLSNDFAFKGWYTNSDYSGSPISTEQVYTFEVNSNIKLYPKFEPTNGRHLLTVTGDANGSLNGGGVYKDNELVCVSVIPACGYEFTGWTNGKYGELISTNPYYKFNIKKDTNLYAHFKKLYCHVTVDCGTLGTSVQSSTGYYGKYDSVTVEAKPNDDNYVFDCWKDADGNVISQKNPYNIYLQNDIELYAQFVKKSTKHTVKLVKGQNGTFSGSSTRTYNDGSKASITATPNEGYKFVGWKIYGTNILVSRRATYNFYVTEDVTYQPVFDKENSTVYHYLGVYSADEGGNVSKVTGYHVHGESVPIEATPKTGYRFTGWTNKAGDTVSTKSQLTVSISNSKYFYAHFEKIPYHTVELVDGAYGSFTGAYIREYLEGEKASITAVPDEGYQFVGWKIVGTNILVSRRLTYNFYVNEDVKYQPVFDENNSTSYHYLGVYAANEGGSVSKVTGYHVHGESVAIEAIPEDGYKFTGWTNKAGDTVSTKSQLTVTMSNSKYFYAHFEKISG